MMHGQQTSSGERLSSPRRAAKQLALVMIVACSILAACGQPVASIPVTGQAAVQVLTPQPTATPTVDPMTLQNAALGCAPHAPAPLPGVLTTGHKPGSSGPAPNEVALTFDDGPTPYTSPPILDVLEKTHTPATFFVEGQYIREWPNLLQREWHDGFAVAVHTWDHPLMSKLTPAQMEHQFGDTLKAMHDILGTNACVWIWRPPYADYNDAVLQMAAHYGLTTVTWDDSSDDWDRPGVSKIAENVLSQAHPGAIVLMHDGPALRDQTAAALPEILAGLKARGLVPVTLPKLLADGGYPGVSVQTTSPASL